jgi:hypothetical protein
MPPSIRPENESGHNVRVLLHPLPLPSCIYYHWCVLLTCLSISASVCQLRLPAILGACLVMLLGGLWACVTDTSRFIFPCCSFDQLCCTHVEMLLIPRAVRAFSMPIFLELQLDPVIWSALLLMEGLNRIQGS